jgi:hypothetical protein
MAKHKRKPKADENEVAKFIVDTVSGEADQAEPADPPTETEQPAKNPAAVALGRLGGLKGGAARAKALNKKQRSEIAKKAARARWKKKPS